MQWTIPGTVITAPTEQASQIEEQFRAMFLGGGIALGQVANITGLAPHDIQNWVKRGFLSRPENKKYSLRQLCRILNINMLRAALPMEEICGLLQYINGSLSDESDDLIDDATLYFLFVRLAAHHRLMHNSDGRDSYIAAALEDYQEAVPGAKYRVQQVLQVMLTAWAAALLRQAALKMTADLKETN